MALMRKPLPQMPYNGGRWGPPGAFRHRVRSGESWASLSQRDGWGQPIDLVKFNFRTTDPREVNWYLKNFVGCVLETDDGKNYRFSDGAKPGHIFTRTLFPEDAAINTGPYVPPPLPTPIPDDDDGTPAWWARSGTWWGVGGKVGGHGGIEGVDVVSAAMFSYETMSDCFLLRIHTSRQGPGVGLSGGLVFVFVTGIKRPTFLRGVQTDGLDFNVAVGGKWGALAKSAAKLPNIAKIANAAKLGHLVLEQGDQLSELSNAMKGLYALAGVEPGSSQVAVTVIDSGIGGGLELSVYWAVNKYEVPWVHDSLA